MYLVENLGLPVENLWKTPVPNKLQSYLKATVRGREILNQARYAFVSGNLRAMCTPGCPGDKITVTIQALTFALNTYLVPCLVQYTIHVRRRRLPWYNT